jgi:hypothetical protein
VKTTSAVLKLILGVVLFGLGVFVAVRPVFTHGAVLTGTVYNDVTDSGAADTSEAPVVGVTVQLYDSNGHVVGQQTTNGSGSYSFLMPGGTSAST